MSALMSSTMYLLQPYQIQIYYKQTQNNTIFCQLSYELLTNKQLCKGSVVRIKQGKFFSSF